MNTASYNTNAARRTMLRAAGQLGRRLAVTVDAAPAAPIFEQAPANVPPAALAQVLATYNMFNAA